MHVSMCVLLQALKLAPLVDSANKAVQGSTDALHLPGQSLAQGLTCMHRNHMILIHVEAASRKSRPAWQNMLWFTNSVSWDN
jgi:hypothetical protein